MVEAPVPADGEAAEGAEKTAEGEAKPAEGEEKADAKKPEAKKE